jgi:hypothetical protein
LSGAGGSPDAATAADRSPYGGELRCLVEGHATAVAAHAEAAKQRLEVDADGIGCVFGVQWGEARSIERCIAGSQR